MIKNKMIDCDIYQDLNQCNDCETKMICDLIIDQMYHVIEIFDSLSKAQLQRSLSCVIRVIIMELSIPISTHIGLNWSDWFVYL